MFESQSKLKRPEIGWDQTSVSLIVWAALESGRGWPAGVALPAGKGHYPVFCLDSTLLSFLCGILRAKYRAALRRESLYESKDGRKVSVGRFVDRKRLRCYGIETRKTQVAAGSDSSCRSVPPVPYNSLPSKLGAWPVARQPSQQPCTWPRSTRAQPGEGVWVPCLSLG